MKCITLLIALLTATAYCDYFNVGTNNNWSISSGLRDLSIDKYDGKTGKFITAYSYEFRPYEIFYGVGSYNCELNRIFATVIHSSNKRIKCRIIQITNGNYSEILSYTQVAPRLLLYKNTKLLFAYHDLNKKSSTIDVFQETSTNFSLIYCYTNLDAIEQDVGYYNKYFLNKHTILLPDQNKNLIQIDW